MQCWYTNGLREGLGLAAGPAGLRCWYSCCSAAICDWLLLACLFFFFFPSSHPPDGYRFLILCFFWSSFSSLPLQWSRVQGADPSLPGSVCYLITMRLLMSCSRKLVQDSDDAPTPQIFPSKRCVRSPYLKHWLTCSYTRISLWTCSCFRIAI